VVDNAKAGCTAEEIATEIFESALERVKTVLRYAKIAPPSNAVAGRNIGVVIFSTNTWPVIRNQLDSPAECSIVGKNHRDTLAREGISRDRD
jgi:hypothetical protein